MGIYFVKIVNHNQNVFCFLYAQNLKRMLYGRESVGCDVRVILYSSHFFLEMTIHEKLQFVQLEKFISLFRL